MSSLPSDCIYIKGLKTEAIIGIYDWEREQPQPLIFDIEMDLPITDAAKSDDIEQTVDYKKVSDEVIAWVQQSRHELLETLCEQICQGILQQHSAVNQVRLKVSKPLAVAETETVGLKITRQRKTS